MEVSKTNVLKKEYSNFTKILILKAMECGYCKKLLYKWHKKFEVSCNQCRQSRCRNCFEFDNSRNFLLQNLDKNGREYLNNFVVNFLNISNVSLKRYFSDTEIKVINRSKTFLIKSYNKSKKNRDQVVNKQLNNCQKISYQIISTEYRNKKLTIHNSIQEKQG